MNLQHRLVAEHLFKKHESRNSIPVWRKSIIVTVYLTNYSYSIHNTHKDIVAQQFTNPIVEIEILHIGHEASHDNTPQSKQL